MTTEHAVQLHHSIADSELDDLLNPTILNAPGSESGFDLNKLLCDSLRAKDDAKRVTEARKRLAAGGLDTAERDATRALVAKWEIEREWNATSNTMMLEVQHCAHCGSQHKHFVGLFQQQEHKTSKISRWVKASLDPKLGKNVKENVSHTGICATCAPLQGWK
jgi:hypothetical protein